MIRDYKISDLEQVKILAEKYNLNLPDEGKMIVAEDNGIIKAFVVLRPVYMVEPFVTENPVIGKKLWDYVEDKASEGNIKIIRCFAQKIHRKLYEKLGFYQIFNKFTPMEKLVKK